MLAFVFIIKFFVCFLWSLRALFCSDSGGIGCGVYSDHTTYPIARDKTLVGEVRMHHEWFVHVCSSQCAILITEPVLQLLISLAFHLLTPQPRCCLLEQVVVGFRV